MTCWRTSWTCWSRTSTWGELGFSDVGEGATDIIEEEGEPKRKVVTCPHCGETFEA